MGRNPDGFGDVLDFQEGPPRVSRQPCGNNGCVQLTLMIDAVREAGIDIDNPEREITQFWIEDEQKLVLDLGGRNE